MVFSSMLWKGRKELFWGQLFKRISQFSQELNFQKHQWELGTHVRITAIPKTENNRISVIKKK